MTTLSIRSRLTLWYAAIVLVVLVASAVVMIVLQSRLGLRRLDGELERLATTVVSVLSNEIDERGEISAAARDAIEEAGIESRAVMILDGRGKLVMSAPAGLNADALATAPVAGAFGTTAASGTPVRMIAIRGAHGGVRYEVRVAASLQPLYAEQRVLVGTLFTGLALALLLAAIGGWVIGRQALRPLVEMARQSAAMAQPADLASPTSRLAVPRSHDEIEELGDAFNGLLARLDSALSAQRQFMADASHELRTPVSVTRTAAQVTLGRDHRHEQEYRDSLTIVAEQARRLSRMVDDMFLLARADAGARPLQQTAMYLDEVVDECVRAARIIAAPRQVSVATTVDPDLMFWGDEDLLRQMISNLLENAVAHTPIRGEVSVSLQIVGDGIELSVADSGPGVPPGDRVRIFERFVRLAPSSHHTGAGLGLPIARWIAERHAGTLTLEPIEQGARFVVRLPCSAGSTKAPAPLRLSDDCRSRS
jgi:signal transduction histidine kinase